MWVKQYQIVICAIGVGIAAPASVYAQSFVYGQTSAVSVATPAQTAAAPSTAQPTATQIPEPGALALFVIGVVGLIVGRWSSRARKRRVEGSK